MHSFVAKHGIGRYQSSYNLPSIYTLICITKKGIYKCHYGIFFSTVLIAALAISVPTSSELIMEN